MFTNGLGPDVFKFTLKGHCLGKSIKVYFSSKLLLAAFDNGPGARFSKVPIINGPGKQLPFTLKIDVSIVLHLT